MTRATSTDDVLFRDEARTRALLVDDVTYDVELDLDAGAETFTSETIVRFTSREPGARTFIDLIAIAVRSAVLNGRPVRAVSGHRLLLEDLMADNELVVSARCAYTRAGVGLHRFVDPVDGRTYLYTHFQPFDAHRVYACFDQPDIKARFTLAVHAPADWVVVSNGAGAGAGRTWRFDPTPPISTYVTALVAGPLHHVHEPHGDLDLGIYCRRSLAEYLDPDEIFQLTHQGLDFYTELFGCSYPFSTYDQLFVPEFTLGAMENVGCVTLDERNIFCSTATEEHRLQRANVILHELSHMWFGNLVTMRWWDDLWLNEGFATYLASLALAEVTRFAERAWVEFAHLYKAWAYAQDQRPTTHPIVAEIPDTAGVLTHVDAITYGKGAAVLKQLAHWVGPDAFRDGVRGYLARHAFGTGELADFLRHLEQASGRELGEWSRQWLTTAGVGVLRTETTIDPAGCYTDFTVVQEPPSERSTPRDHRVAIGLYARDGDAVRRRCQVEIDVSGLRTAVPELVGQRVPDLVLVNDDDLAYTKIRFDPRSTAMLADGLSRIRSPLARALCWGALWEMTRDAELPTRSWVGMVAAHAESEDDIAVLRALLGQASQAIGHYSASGRQAESTATLAAAVQGGLDRAAPGGDAQLIWARRAVAVDPDPTFAQGMLDGTVEVDGLVVDSALRWHLVIRLAALGAIGEQTITAECERDPSGLGRRRAWTARASRPDPRAKSVAFTAAVDGTVDGARLSVATRRSILAGFWRPDQSELLAAYAERGWVEGLRRVWAGRWPDEGLALTSALLPGTRPSFAVVAAADRVLASDLLPAAGRRVVVEGRDDMLRALRAQAADAGPTQDHNPGAFSSRIRPENASKR
ncbi:MAG: aminopeptidase N [Pseudonocardia sp.]